MRSLLQRIILLLLFPALAHAGWLRCPYIQTVNELGAPLRYVALADLAPQFEPLRAKGDVASWPMKREFEVQGTSKTSPNDAILFLDFAPLPAPLQALVTTPVGLGGAGCVTKSDVQKDAELIPGRAPIYDKGVLTFDADDTTRKQIGVDEIATEKAGGKGSAIPPMPSLLWHYALKTLRFLQPRLAFAQQAFPLYSTVIENFNYSDANLDTASSNLWVAGPHTATTLRVLSNTLRRQVSTNGDNFYTKRLFNIDRGGESTITVTFDNGTQSIRLYFCMTQTPTTCSTYNGYSVRWTGVSGGANDTVTLFREDAGADTQISTSITSEYVSGDIVGWRDNYGDFTMYLNGTSIGVRTDTTYKGLGVLGILILGSDNYQLDDWKAGSSAPSGWKGAMQ